MPERRGPDEIHEAEANIFAVELLMPETWIAADMSSRRWPLDIEGDDTVPLMAKRYGVSQQLMTLRLDDLGYFGKR